HETGHGRLSRLELDHVALRDLSPLRALAVSQLILTGTSVSDLSPLAGTKIVSLTCQGLKAADLKSIRGMKELKILSLKSTPLRDLSPLAGLDLWQLNLKGTSAPDLGPLRQVKLRELLCDFDVKRDTPVLRAMPELEKINDLLVEEFWRKENPSVLGPEEAFRAVIAQLRQRNPDFDGRESHQPLSGVVTELTLSALGLVDLSPLQTLTGLRRLDVSGYWDGAEKKEYRSSLRDLGPLRGLKLESLAVHHTAVVDLEPLKEMKLEYLEVASTDVKDLSPLRGMPLRKLDVSWSHVQDLSPLKGMPLTELKLSKTDVADFSLIKSFALKELAGDFDPQKQRPLITGIPGLETVNGLPVAEFLKAAAPPPPPTPAPAPVPAPALVVKPPPEAGPWKNAVDLIPHIDPARDAVRGIWRKENGRIVSEFPENGVLRIPYEPPPEYDFKIVFTRARGSCAVAQFLQRDGRAFFWEMAGWGNVNSGFSLIGGKGSKENPTNASFVPRDGVRYTCVIQVRRDRVTALLDDKKISEWLPSMGEITTDTNWCVDVPNLIGLGNCESLTTFEVVQVREVTGKGRLRTSLSTPPDPAFINTVSRLPAPEQVRKVTDKLKDLNPLFNGEVQHRIEGDRVVEYEVSTQRITDVWPIRALLFLKKLDLEGEGSVLADIAGLKGLKLQELGLANTRVSDLSPLQGMPLQRLQISGTPVRDLAPLRGLPLQQLECERIGTTDFSALKAIRSLKTVNDQPAAEFLKNATAGWKPLFDGKSLDFLRSPAGWRLERGAIALDRGGPNAAQTNLEFENGDLRIRFEGADLDSLFFSVRQSDRGSYSILFDKSSLKPMEGRAHELLFECQGERVTPTLDGKVIALTEVRPGRSGCLQFNATGKTFRILAIDFRAAP
ncbi:MAG: hypothetical protein HY293_11910, partial [Planctomycetes bacterium]|nr:hypothetical protein [Planctomycetota bacterium]